MTKLQNSTKNESYNIYNEQKTQGAAGWSDIS